MIHLIEVIFKISIRTAKKIQNFSITRMLFKKIIVVYSVSNTKPIDGLCVQNAEILIILLGFKGLRKVRNKSLFYSYSYLVHRIVFAVG